MLLIFQNYLRKLEIPLVKLLTAFIASDFISVKSAVIKYMITNTSKEATRILPKLKMCKQSLKPASIEP